MVLRKGKKLRTNQKNKIKKLNIWLLWTNKDWSQDAYKKYTSASPNSAYIDFPKPWY